MSKDVLQRTIDLRAEVFMELEKSSLFQSLKALDGAVVAMGGHRMLFEGSAAVHDSKPQVRAVDMPIVRRRISQGDVAAQVLVDNGAPMPIRDLLEAVTARGINIRGDDPLANFRSTLSRDQRLASVMHNGGYFWWLKDEALPESWNEAEAEDLVGRLASASVFTSQKGGDGDAADNTDLAS